MREHEPARRRRARTTDPDDDPSFELIRRREPSHQARARAAEFDGRFAVPDVPEGADRWSTWDGAEHGPHPRPSWVVTAAAAVDIELGMLRTGKEADVHLLERAVPGEGRRTLLAAKRYRAAEHRMFHRDAAYQEGRRVRRSRETRAMARRTGFGRDLLAGQWASAEFAALARLWSRGVPVPYPVSLEGTEVLLEFVGDPDGAAAPRLADLRPAGAELHDLWQQLVDALVGLAGLGLAHGDLSAYNLLVHNGRLILIDLPQVVDVVVNPGGPDFLARDVANVTGWFAARGLPAETADPGALLALLLAELGPA